MHLLCVSEEEYCNLAEEADKYVQNIEEMCGQRLICMGDGFCWIYALAVALGVELEHCVESQRNEKKQCGLPTERDKKMVTALLKEMRDNYEPKIDGDESLYDWSEPSIKQMGTTGGVAWFKLAARVFNENVLVINKITLDRMQSGEPTIAESPHELDGETCIILTGGDVTNMSLSEVAQHLVLTKNKRGVKTVRAPRPCCKRHVHLTSIPSVL